MAQSGWRLPEELLRRVRVRCAESGERQNVFVERALESALETGGSLPGGEPRVSRGQNPAPSRASVPYKLPPSEPVPKPAVPKSRMASAVPGVRPARDFVLDRRQAALNKARKS